jgi:hypothetical protein
VLRAVGSRDILKKKKKKKMNFKNFALVNKVEIMIECNRYNYIQIQNNRPKTEKEKIEKEEQLKIIEEEWHDLDELRKKIQGKKMENIILSKYFNAMLEKWDRI